MFASRILKRSIMSHTFFMQRTRWFSWISVLFTATRDRSRIHITRLGLDIRFGWFHQFVTFGDLETVEFEGKLPWYAAQAGWRCNWFGRIWLLGDTQNIVRLNLKKRRWVNFGLPVLCNALSISLEEPYQFINALLPHLKPTRGTYSTQHLLKGRYV
jgi:hypothetical protein